MLIAIEGIDGSGKGTQTRLLEQRLLREGNGVTVFSFPRYTENFFGKEVGRYLDGQFGELKNVDPKFSALLYALDRFESNPQIAAALGLGQYVICDRYIGSNIAHQCARVPRSQAADLGTWIETVEKSILKTREPDLVFFLDINVQQSNELVAKKNRRVYTDKKHDLHEASSDHLENALANFRHLAQTNRWVTIFCNRPDGVLRAVDEISEEIYGHIYSKK